MTRPARPRPPRPQAFWCVLCGTELEPYGNDPLFCSGRCRSAPRTRNATSWRSCQREFRKASEQAQSPCGLCGEPIDYSIKGLDHPMRFSAHHVLRWADHPQLRLDWSNLLATHAVCNSREDQQHHTQTELTLVLPPLDA